MPESPRLQEKALKCTIIGLFKAFANTGEATGRKKAGPYTLKKFTCLEEGAKISQLQVKYGPDKWALNSQDGKIHLEPDLGLEWLL